MFKEFELYMRLSGNQHRWIPNNNIEHRCAICGKTEAHSWSDNGDGNHACTVCGATEAHDWYNGLYEHRCLICGKTEAHSWSDNGDGNHVCTVCGVTRAHDYHGGMGDVTHTCTDCGGSTTMHTITVAKTAGGPKRTIGSIPVSTSTAVEIAGGPGRTIIRTIRTEYTVKFVPNATMKLDIQGATTAMARILVPSAAKPGLMIG